jgi:uncharacterized protein (TIGR00369 family)
MKEKKATLSKKSIQKYSHCFVCGDKNDVGLKIDFYYEQGKAKAEYEPNQNFEGYKEILHGGIISTLLDEVMIKAILAEGQMTVTSQIDVKFKIPALIGDKIFLEGWIKDDKKRFIIAEGRALKENGKIIAVSSGKYFKVKGQMKKQLERSLD